MPSLSASLVISAAAFTLGLLIRSASLPDISARLNGVSVRLALTSGVPECMAHPSTMWHNGTCNNGALKNQGAAHEPFKLLFPPSKRDPRSNELPSARLVSNTVCHEEHTVLNRRGITEFWTYFGQLLDHTIAETHLGKEQMNIPIPHNDPFFAPGGVLFFTRTAKKATPGGTSPENVLSSYVDASSVYGVSKQLTDRLRTKQGGRLRMSAGNLLPRIIENGRVQFAAGDPRANENPALQAMHTLFAREHNRVADELAAAFGDWGDEALYDTARRVVNAEFQAVAFYEFVPAILGRHLPRYTGYKSWVDASISNEFATAIYRVGHTLINPEFTLYGRDGRAYTKQLRETFFRTDVLLADGIDGVLRGTLNTRAAEVDVRITSQVRNFLTLGTPLRVDLAALNIQRGRDHAVPAYNELRTRFGLPALTSISEITADPAVQKKLHDAYGGDVEKVDPWVGGLAEDHHRPGSLGPLFTRAWISEFTRMRDGNRFYFENKKYFKDEILEKSPTVQQLLREKGFGGTMRRIILQNTDLKADHIPLHPFRLLF